MTKTDMRSQTDRLRHTRSRVCQPRLPLRSTERSQCDRNSERACICEEWKN